MLVAVAVSPYIPSTGLYIYRDSESVQLKVLEDRKLSVMGSKVGMPLPSTSRSATPQLRTCKVEALP